MPFVGFAIVPHSPLLAPTVGKGYHAQARRTHRALAQLAAELYALQPDTAIVLHPHGPSVPGTFTALAAEHFEASLTEFGDLVTRRDVSSDQTLLHELRERAEDHGFPLTLQHVASLSHDVTVPLLALAAPLPQLRLVPITMSDLDDRAHVDFGRLVAEAMHAVRSRVVVIASAELSHHVTAVAPGGARPEGANYDRAILRIIGRPAWSETLLALDPTLVELAESCGHRPLLTLAGVIARKHVVVRRLAYESPFGIGMLTASGQAA